MRNYLCLPLCLMSFVVVSEEPTLIQEGVRKYYETGVEEMRLYKGSARLEMARVESMLKRFLPKPPAAIADIGGGVGAYAFSLADEGYVVSLIDPVATQIEMAQKHDKKRDKNHLQLCAVGDARKVPLDDASVDVVLLFGPLYHLDHADRLLALSEARRVLKSGGLLLAQTVSRYAVYINSLFDGKLGLSEHDEMVNDSLINGRFEYRGAVFYCQTPDETKVEVDQAGFSNIQLLSVEGLGKWLKPGFWENEEIRNRVLAYAQQTEGDPSLLGATSHIMVVARKK